MFRKMRRIRQELAKEKCIEILEKESSGVLALSGDDDYPYALPISYVYDDTGLYFHSAAEGHKIDAIRKQEKASFCVIAQDRVIPEKYTTCYRSVIVFGKIHILEDETEKRRALYALAAKYHPDGTPNDHQAAIEKDWNRVCMIQLSIEQISGKEAIELKRI